MNTAKLPRLMIITQNSLMRPDFSTALAAVTEGGAPLIQLREKEIASEEFFELARVAKTICEPRSAQLVINGNWETAREAGAGLHLPEASSTADARRALGREYFIGQSAHSLEAAQRAQSDGADYIVFGAFQWARVCGTVDLLEPGDSVAAWRERALDLHGGIAREAPARVPETPAAAA